MLALTVVDRMDATEPVTVLGPAERLAVPCNFGKLFRKIVNKKLEVG